MKANVRMNAYGKLVNDDKVLSPEALYLRYLEKHPGHISDLFFVLEVKREREEVKP